MSTRRASTWLTYLIAGVTAASIAVAGGAPTTASEPAMLGAAPAATAIDPIVGQWSYQGGIVEVTGSNGNFAGRIVQATSFNQCVHQVGQQMWTIHGSNGSYSGTHVGFNLADCTDLPMSATFTLSDNGDGTLSLRLCAEAGCATLQRAVPPDTSPPDVTLDAPNGIVPLGRSFKVRWTVTDDSEEAKVTATMYSNGSEVFIDATDGLVEAKGATMVGTVDPVSGFPGPFYLCMSAEDAAGNKSVNWPQTECAWLSLEVALDQLPSVANGCGGAQWGDLAASVQNWLLDTKSYGGEEVNFRLACNQHDAGYAGITVYDPFLRKVVDFRKWSRLRVDNKFYDDLGTLCRKQLSSKVSKLNTFRCTRGLPLDKVLLTELAGKSPGALAYYEAVRAYAEAAFDTNVTRPGVQTDNNPPTWPEGGGRKNA
ncbi:MAG: hypothetical protein Q7V58_06970 [Actinomycetota bacterium]|nr:hypothetical protein [Actinomycetota bacterium]